MATASSAPQYRIVHDKAEHKFVAEAVPTGDRLDAYVTYVHPRGKPHVYDLNHTFVNPKFRGQGLAAIVCDGAFQQIEEEGGTVIPTCSYISETFLKTRPHLMKLLAHL